MDQYAVMDEEILLHALHATSVGCVFVLVGAGSSLLTRLLAVGGASQTVLEGLAPYHAKAFEAFLGQKVQKYVSADVAQLAAGLALQRAKRWQPNEQGVLGVACTATIATNRPKAGPHHAHIAIWSAEAMTHTHLLLDKGVRSRKEEEELISTLLLNRLAEAHQLPHRLPLPLRPTDTRHDHALSLRQTVQKVADGALPYAGVTKEGVLIVPPQRPKLLLSGAFNPLHAGHLALAQAASRWANAPIVFELAMSNADKPTLTTDEVVVRLSQFAGQETIYLSKASTFVEKTAIYGEGVTFVVGFDTAKRLLQARFYGNSAENCAAALRTIQQYGGQFLVAGRLEGGKFLTVADLPLSAEFTSLFHALPNFRVDLSSTQLRNGQR